MKHKEKSQSFYGKSLLLGEYTVLAGSEALAVPIPSLFGRWMPPSTPPQVDVHLVGLVSYVEKHKDLSQWLDLSSFRKDVHEGWSFSSNIPLGYGAGSSGAVSAAVLAKYGPTFGENQVEGLREALIALESHFHGKSSGVDALVSYLAKAIHVKSNLTYPLESPKRIDGFSWLLLDTGQSRQTAQLVPHFLEAMQSKPFSNQVKGAVNAWVATCIEAWLSGKVDVLWAGLRQISSWQLLHMSKMIPHPWQVAWAQCLASEHTIMKLCGAGGGGFLLIGSKDVRLSKALLGDYRMIEL